MARQGKGLSAPVLPDLCCSGQAKGQVSPRHVGCQPWLAQQGLGPCLQPAPCQAGGQQPPTGPLLPPQLSWAGGSCRVRSDPIFFQFSLKPLERHHPHRLVWLGLSALTLSVPVQSELSIFVVQYLYTLLKCFYEIHSSSCQASSLVKTNPKVYKLH